MDEITKLKEENLLLRAELCKLEPELREKTITAIRKQAGLINSARVCGCCAMSKHDLTDPNGQALLCTESYVSSVNEFKVIIEKNRPVKKSDKCFLIKKTGKSGWKFCGKEFKL